MFVHEVFKYTDTSAITLQYPENHVFSIVWSPRCRLLPFVIRDVWIVNSVVSDGIIYQRSFDPCNAMMQPALHNVQWPEEEHLCQENKEYVFFCYFHTQEGARWIMTPQKRNVSVGANRSTHCFRTTELSLRRFLARLLQMLVGLLLIFLAHWKLVKVKFSRHNPKSALGDPLR